MQTYLFYDIETTGLNKAFDQVLRFAAIRTDMQLHELERFEIPIRLRPDIVMSPMALLTHRISVDDAQIGEPEYEAVRKIHRLLNAPYTISIGYNTLGFDDEFLRFSFHRNLLPPYTHQYASGCRRMDILPFAVIYRLYKENVLKWPVADGAPSLKLELLNELNHLAPGMAHDAMVDVEATIALARHFAEEKETWAYLSAYFEKKIDAKRFSDLPSTFQTAHGNHVKGLLASHDLGPDANYQAPVLFIGNSIPYANQSLWLRLDLPELPQVTPESVDEHSWVVRKRFGEPPFILPPMERFWMKLPADKAQIADDNLKWLMTHETIFNAVAQYHQQFRYPDVPDVDADAALYQMGFLSKSEEKLCRRFHSAPLSEKPTIASEFRRSELRQLSERILYRNYDDKLPEKLHPRFKKYMQRVHPNEQHDAMVDYQGNRRATPLGTIAEIEKLTCQENMDPSKKVLLEELSQYIHTRFMVPF